MANVHTILELRRQRANVVKQYEEVLNRHKEEKRSLTQEEENQLDKLHNEEVSLRKQIEREEYLEEQNKSLAGHENRFMADDKEKAEVNKDEYRSVFSKWLTGGVEMLSTEERNLLFSQRSEERAMSAGTNTAGGYTVPQGFYNKLIEALKFYGGMRDVANVIQTEMGNALPIPSVNDTSQVGAIVAENTAVTQQDVTFGQVTLNAYKYTSKLILVSMELLQDSAFNLEDYLAKALGVRIGRIHNTHFTTGTGTSQPQGVVTGATLGTTGATGQTTSIVYDDLIELEHAVDIAYRPNAQFMMHDSTLKSLKKLKDSYGRPLWLPGLAFKEPDTINGYKYTLNNDMATMAASAKSMLFGDFSNYWIRDVLGITLVRFNEKYMDSGQVGFVAFARADGKLVNAGTNPIAYYQNSAT
ncbi:phage major capsid protein [Ectobacillus ponti]|uniref:Phage major capsid protein n=1 Tax=Ectobacillus ponti TaxID=2961894 RepID=A0AA41X7X7_9BACI|nr:phage major capsid protein [Ectobacillus ponti]MCP8970566.1 phage major capsid protein [Ectobacillus ponti]